MTGSRSAACSSSNATRTNAIIIDPESVGFKAKLQTLKDKRAKMHMFKTGVCK
jgi:hypothetical protein